MSNVCVDIHSLNPQYQEKVDLHETTWFRFSLIFVEDIWEGNYPQVTKPPLKIHQNDDLSYGDIEPQQFNNIRSELARNLRTG